MCLFEMEPHIPSATPPSSIKSFNSFVNNGNETEMKTIQRKSSDQVQRDVSKKLSSAAPVESSSDRLQQIELLERFLEQHDSCLAKLAVENLQSGLDPSGKDVERKKPHGYRTIYLYLAYLHKKFGLRHILLLLLLIGYTLIGGLIFDAIESQVEIQNLQSMFKVLMQNIDKTSEEIISVVLSTNNQANRKAEVAVVIKEFYKGMLNTEGLLYNSVFDKADNNRTVWNFESAVFYAMCLYTTTGYGSIVCASTWGRVVSVIYAVIGIPLMLVVINDLGRLLYVSLRQLDYRYYQMCRRNLTQLFQNEEEEEDTVEQSFSLRIAIPLVVLYLLLCASVVHMFDYKLRGEDKDGLNFLLSFYFTFISMATIGLGDVMPVNIQYSPVVAGMFMFGLVLFSVIINSIYARVEHNYFGAMEAMEMVLDKLCANEMKGSNHRYHIFRAMSDTVRLAAMIALHFDNESGQGRSGLDTIPNSLRTSLTSQRRLSLLLPERLRKKRQSTSSDFNPLQTLSFNLDVAHKLNELNKSEKADLKRSMVTSRSDTDLIAIHHHANCLDVNSAMISLRLRPYLDIISEVNDELTQERTPADILRSRIAFYSDAELFFDRLRRNSLQLP